VWASDELLLTTDGSHVLTLRPDGAVIESAQLEKELLDQLRLLPPNPAVHLMPPVR
jgi:hypothetical protein